MKLGNLLRDFRLSRDMRNRSEFARRVEMSVEGYRLVESGQRIPRKGSILRICEVLNLEDWERAKLLVRWLDEKFRIEASEVLTNSEVGSLISRFQEMYEPLLREAMVDLPEEKQERNTKYLLTVTAIFLDMLLGQEKEEG